MSIPIKTNTNDDHQLKMLTISFDLYGNLYFHENNDQLKAYQLNISGRNIPHLHFGDYEIITKYSEKIKTFSVLDKNNSLKAKIKFKIEKEQNEYEEFEYNSDDDYDLDGDNKVDYYPEDNDHLNNEDSNDDSNDIDIMDEENIKLYGQNNRKFTFWNNTFDNLIPIFDRNDGDIMALYDVYIYNNDKLVFKSNSPDNTSIYRFRINISNGDIYFRPVGYPEKQFTLNLNNESLEFTEII